MVIPCGLKRCAERMVAGKASGNGEQVLSFLRERERKHYLGERRGCGVVPPSQLFVGFPSLLQQCLISFSWNARGNAVPYLNFTARENARVGCSKASRP